MQERAYQTLIVAEAGGVATITLNRPDRRNAIGTQMTNELLYALEDATEATSVSSIVITGAGKAFCAGGDFTQMTGQGGGEELPFKGDYKNLLDVLFFAKKPVIARVNGHAMGGGLGIVAACTFAVASTDAKLGTPEINVGLFPFMIYAVLERVMPRRRLMEMMLGGERLTAEDAASVGLVNRAVPPEQLDAAVKHYTDLMAEKSASTIRLGMEAVRDTDGATLGEKLPVLSERLGKCLATDDAREGLMAFLEKRAPKWTGR